MNFLKKFFFKHIMPSRGNHISDTWNLDINWKKCQEFYGENFNFQLIKINRKRDRVWLPPISFFRTQTFNYLNNVSNGHFNFFKTQWLLNDYLTIGFKYPVQAVWNWRMRWWEIHPGFQRGLIYNLFNLQEWVAWYQPITNKKVECLYKSTEPYKMLSDLGYTDYSFIDAELIGYFNKPLIKFCVHIAGLDDSANKHHNIFYKNIKNGIQIKGDDNVIKSIKKEINKWPDHKLKQMFIFEDIPNVPTLHFKKYDKNMFYVGIYFAGTTLDNWEGFGFEYKNPTAEV